MKILRKNPNEKSRKSQNQEIRIFILVSGFLSPESRFFLISGFLSSEFLFPGFGIFYLRDIPEILIPRIGFFRVMGYPDRRPPLIDNSYFSFDNKLCLICLIRDNYKYIKLILTYDFFLVFQQFF